MDYKELIEQLKHCKSYKPKYELQRTMIEAATAIETLLAERDAAVKDLRNGSMQRCRSCAHQECGVKDFPCFSCKDTGGFSDYWEWRGPTKGETNDQEKL